MAGMSSENILPPSSLWLLLLLLMATCSCFSSCVADRGAISPFFLIMSTFDPVSSGYGMQEASGGSEMEGGDNFSCRWSNLSSHSISDESHWKINQSSVTTIVTGCIILIFFLVGFFWNLFIIVTILVKHHLLKESGIVFLFNVAITDFFVCVTILPFALVTAFSREFVFGNSDTVRCTMCGVSGFFLSFLMLVTLHLLCALSVDRFIVFSYPLRYKRIMNNKKALVICIFVYVLCFVLALMPQVGFGEIEFSLTFGSCVPRFSPTRNLYYIIVVGVEMCIPSAILAITNVWTFRFASNFLARNLRRNAAYPRNQDSNRRSTRHQKQQAQLVKVFGAMLLANIFSYLPTMIMGFIAFILNLAYDGRVVPPPEAYIFAYICFLTYPVSHPIIESSFVKDLRYELKRAKKHLGQAGSAFYQQTTQLASVASHLDETRRSMDNLNSRSPSPSPNRLAAGQQTAQGRARSISPNPVPALHSSSHLSPPTRFGPSNGFCANGVRKSRSSSPVDLDRSSVEAQSAVRSNNRSCSPKPILFSHGRPDKNLSNVTVVLEDSMADNSSD